MKFWLCSFFLWAYLCGANVFAQPVLPAISCSVSGDSVQLLWRCNYASVRSIHVSRSFDSTRGFVTIGQPSSLLPGIQSYTDRRPVDGSTFYKVSLTFSSGLVWHSNHCAIVYKGKTTSTIPFLNSVASTGKVVPLSLPPTDLTDISYIKPIHVSLSAATGHVKVILPPFSANTCYSLTFYDMQGQLVADIPRLKVREFLIDKRNFQRSGTYRFVLRKDGVLLESATIRVFL